MWRLFTIYLDIAFLRAGPQALPSASLLSVLSVLAYFSSTLLSQVLAGSADQAIGLATTVTILLIAMTLLVLRLRGVMVRAPQTLSALAGTGTLLNLLMLPMSLLIAQSEGALAPALTLTVLVVFFWSFALDGHILRHALSVSFTEGVLVATLFFAVGASFNHWLFNTPA